MSEDPRDAVEDGDQQRQLEAIGEIDARRREGVREAATNPQDPRSVRAAVLEVCLFGYIGTVVGGGAMGCLLIPVLGAVFGMAFAAASGAIPILLAGGLMLIVRHRISMVAVATWAGSLAGAACISTASGMGPRPEVLAFSSVAAVFGGVGARWLAARAAGRVAPSAVDERWKRQFTIRDSLLLTGWFAVLMTALQLYVRVADVSWVVAGAMVATSLVVTLVIEGFALVGWRSTRSVGR